MPKDSLKTRLEIAKSKISKRNLYKDKEPPSSIGTAFKLSTELVSAVAVGTIIGFILDTTFGTKPWLILIFFFCRCGCWYCKCIQIRKKYAKNRLKNYGNKSNAPI
jgi:ATP synthase protein I